MAKKPALDTSNMAREDAEFAIALDEHLRAGYQALYINTTEEARVESEIARVAKALDMQVVTWDIFEGFSLESLRGKKEYLQPALALQALAKDDLFNKDAVFVFRDLDDYTADSQVRRRIRSLTEGNRLVNKRHKRPIIIISPKLDIHPKLRASLSVLDFNLPGEEKLDRTLEFVRQSIEASNPEKARVDDVLRTSIVTNLMGLTSNEAENCLSRCLVKHGGFKPEMLKTIKDEKAQIVKKSEVLTYIDENAIASRDEIGGFDSYLDWLDLRKLAYTPAARVENIDYPKGVVLMGVPGTGKSLVGKATCKVLQLPGYILDVGAVFGSLVGESEQRMRDAIKQIEAQKGCVLVVDEADKAFGNAHDSQGDSGVTKRVFGSFLTWLAEKQSRTFVIMTLNRSKGLPPEFLRAGRFDEVFYTDVPGEEARKEILEIHLRKRGVDPNSLDMEKEDWDEVIKATNQFVGSELEEVVRAARYQSFAARKTGKPSFEDLVSAAKSIMPMAQRDAEGVAEIREFCKDRARPVSRLQAMATSPQGKQHRNVDLG